jgi:hypothetical protein
MTVGSQIVITGGTHEGMEGKIVAIVESKESRAKQQR